VRNRLIWLGLGITAAAVATLIVIVGAGGGSGGGVSASGPVVSVDDPRLTDAQRRRATEVLEQTRRALGAFPDEERLLAAGYRSFSDLEAAIPLTGAIEHFINANYLADGRELDPRRIESVLTERQPDGSKVVVAAMYILEPGASVADAPDLAGELTRWHDHGAVCLDESGAHVEGLLVNGKCARGAPGRLPPMMHVWLADTPCGPFAGLGEHGGACLEPDASHE
jgi:hypothetical protein